MSRVVLITGATRGFGLELVRTYIDQGWCVAINYRTENKAFHDLEQSLNNNANVFFVCSDVSDKASIAAMFESIIKKWKKIDLVINNAGVSSAKLLCHEEECSFDAIFQTNIQGVRWVCAQAIAHMKNTQGGHIINIASMHALKPGYGASLYAMSKAAIVGYSKRLAKEVGAYNIRVNLICPGFMNTDMTQSLGVKEADRVIQTNVLKRLSNFKNITQSVYHLSCTQDISGQIFNLDSRIY